MRESPPPPLEPWVLIQTPPNHNRASGGSGMSMGLCHSGWPGSRGWMGPAVVGLFSPRNPRPHLMCPYPEAQARPRGRTKEEREKRERGGQAAQGSLCTEEQTVVIPIYGFLHPENQIVISNHHIWVSSVRSQGSGSTGQGPGGGRERFFSPPNRRFPNHSRMGHRFPLDRIEEAVQGGVGDGHQSGRFRSCSFSISQGVEEEQESCGSITSLANLGRLHTHLIGQVYISVPQLQKTQKQRIPPPPRSPMPNQRKLRDRGINPSRTIRAVFPSEGGRAEYSYRSYGSRNSRTSPFVSQPHSIYLYR
ncbi:hypothetical protein BDP55DRAFT_177763 [Colletotrichum godetiae]|uniref:Uncharacterized protein n=1 Tax=Colletotrichum godetiae TaxID=1209918 RepID=A0AAJ0ES10_9PEZI|nr:uncharacterized protein BDP55DRAFT_177763 [Colletotrichum godetiae]KAK1674541.1 hypothetical protein BDP55DRAFT_177763 [Colletotrichum godetiae]